jgi:hypothetical protein
LGVTDPFPWEQDETLKEKSMTNIDQEISRNQLKYHLIIGGLAGFSFAFATWGIESIGLLSSHAMFPLAKFLIGGLVYTLIGLLAGWLTKIFTSVLTNVIIWTLVAVAFNRLALYITFPGMQTLLGWLDPAVQQRVNYVIDYGVSTRATLMLVIMIVFGLIVGLLVNSFTEEASVAAYGFRRWSTLLLWMAAFIGVGILGDSLNQKALRDAVRVVDNAVQFQLDHEGEDLPVSVQVRMGLTGLKPVVGYVHSARRMIPAEYDQMLIFIQVLVQFDDTYAMCSVINNQMGTCRLLENP